MSFEVTQQQPDQARFRRPLREIALAAGTGLLLAACSSSHHTQNNKPSSSPTISATPTTSPDAVLHFTCASGYADFSESLKKDPASGETTLEYHYTPVGNTASGQVSYAFEKIEEPGTDPGFIVEVQSAGESFDETVKAQQLRISAGFIIVTSGAVTADRLQTMLNTADGYHGSSLADLTCRTLFDNTLAGASSTALSTSA